MSLYHLYLAVLLLSAWWFNNIAADSARFVMQEGSSEVKMPWLSSITTGELCSRITTFQNTQAASQSLLFQAASVYLSYLRLVFKKALDLKKPHTQT